MGLSPSASNIGEDKASLRLRMATQRRQKSRLWLQVASARAQAALQSIAAYHRAGVILSYGSIRGEVETDGLHDVVVAQGRRLFLPVPGGELQFRGWCPGEPLDVGPLGFRGPSSGIEYQGTDAGVILVPVVAWDRTGGRLGRGAGFYDRFLAATSGTMVRIGLAFDFQRVEAVPHEAWDARLDFYVSESGVHPCHG